MQGGRVNSPCIGFHWLLASLPASRARSVEFAHSDTSRTLRMRQRSSSTWRCGAMPRFPVWGQSALRVKRYFASASPAQLSVA